jgi:hypothetical protein
MRSVYSPVDLMPLSQPHKQFATFGILHGPQDRHLIAP